MAADSRLFWTLRESANFLAFGHAVDQDMTARREFRARFGRINESVINELLAMAEGRMVPLPTGADPARAYAGRQAGPDLLMKLGNPDPRAAAAEIRAARDRVAAKVAAYRDAELRILDTLKSHTLSAAGPYRGRSAVWFHRDEVEKLRQGNSSSEPPSGPAAEVDQPPLAGPRHP